MKTHIRQTALTIATLLFPFLFNWSACGNEPDFEAIQSLFQERAWAAQAAKSGELEGGVKVGELAPDILLLNASGEEVHLKDLRGKIVFLTFSLSTSETTPSGPFKGTTDSLTALHSEFSEKGVVVAVVFPNLSQHNLSVIRDAGYQWLVSKPFETPSDSIHALQKQTNLDYGVYVIGTSFVIDPAGVVRNRLHISKTEDIKAALSAIGAIQ